MELIFILAIVFIKVFLVNLLQVVQIVRTLGVYSLMDYEVFALLLLYKGMGTVRTFKMEF